LVVDVAVLLDLEKHARAHTIAAVAISPPAINTPVDNVAACCSPAAGPGDNSGAGSAGAGVSLVAGADGVVDVVAAPAVPAPPLSAWAVCTGVAETSLVVCAKAGGTVAAIIVAPSAKANQFLCILIPVLGLYDTLHLMYYNTLH
jgi:hypothetical protein